jgi:inner membrane protein
LDSLTQLVLGAAVGEATLGRKVSYRAAVWGAVCGTLPDLDVFIPMGSAVADVTYHRSFSHSLFILPLLAPLFVWLILKIHPQTSTLRKNWIRLVLLVFLTHIALDTFTVYGTQIFWPLNIPPIGLGSIFVIDPLYTIPLAIGLLIALIMGSASKLAFRANVTGLTLSSLYLVWSVVAQIQVEQAAQTDLANKRIQYERLLVTPTPFNTLLWNIVAVDEGNYYTGLYSLLDREGPLDIKAYNRNLNLLQTIETHWPAERLRWFSKGFYKVDAINSEVVISDLRMGVEPNFAFRFIIGLRSEGLTYPVPNRRFEEPRPWDRIPELLRRIWQQPPG